MHPDREHLSRYVLGSLPEDQASEIERHVSSCPECEATLTDMEGLTDTIIDVLRRPASTDHYEEESRCREMLLLIEGIGRDLSFSSDQVMQAPESDRPALGYVRDYCLLEKLGAGGMGTVYKALHTQLDKVVAVKVLPPGRVRDEQAVARFKREMKAVGKLAHPNIVVAFDAGEADGTHFLVMEYIQGIDLSALVRLHGPSPISDACELVRQAATGLAYAHQHGLVHRDIKPSNLMLSWTGERRAENGESDQCGLSALDSPPSALVKILDMGLALLGESQPQEKGELTSTGQVMGTLDYMAPEQGSDSHEVDIRADIYSLGATLYKLLCGEAPFAGKQYNTPVKKLMAVATRPATPIGERRPEVPLGLSVIVDRLLAKEPSDRFATPHEVAEALAPFAEGHDLASLFEPPPDESQSDSVTDPAVTRTSSCVASEEVKTLTVRSSPERAGKKSASRPAVVGTRALLLLLLAAIVFFVQTKDGVIRVEINDPDIEVSIKGKEVVLRQTDQGKEVRLSPGDHTLIVKRGDFEFETDKLILRKGETVIVKVELLAGEIQVRAGDRPIGQEKLPQIATGPPLAVAPFDADQAKKHQQAWAEYLNRPVEQDVDLGKDVKLTMVLVPPGEFMMGSSEDDKTRVQEMLTGVPRQMMQWMMEVAIAREQPQHQVRITKPFALSRHEVTRGQFRRFIEETGYKTIAEQDGKGGHGKVTGESVRDPRYIWSAELGFPQTDDHPVVNVSSDDAIAFCQWLSKKEGVRYHLPSEAQWEYACRAGTATLWHHGDDQTTLQDYAWFPVTLGSRTHPVGRLKPNAWGLYDMHGNVWEYCADWFYSKYYAGSPLNDPVGPREEGSRGSRGGGHSHKSVWGRSAMRYLASADDAVNCEIGFRIACEVPYACENNPVASETTSASPLVASPLPANVPSSKRPEWPDSVEPRTTGSTAEEPWQPGPAESVLPGLIARPAQRPGIGRWQLETVLPRSEVWSVAWSPDGCLLALGTHNGLVRIYDGQTRELVRLLVAHAGHVSSLAWKHDGRQLASVSHDGTVCVWNVDGTLARAFREKRGLVSSVAWHPDGKRLVWGGQGGIRVSELEATPRPFSQDYSKTVLSIAWSPDGQQLASAGDDNDPTVRLWNSDGTPIGVLEGHERAVHCLAWSPDGLQLASASDDFTARLWNMDGTEAAVLKLWSYVKAVAWSPDGKKVLTTSGDGMWLWTASGTKEHSAKNGQFGNCAAWHPDGNWFVVAGRRGRVDTLNIDGEPETFIEGHPACGGFVAWSPEGETLAAAHHDRLWQWDCNGRFEKQVEIGGYGAQYPDWHPNGDRIATDHNDRWIRVWRTTGEGKPLVEVEADFPRWSPDGQWLAVITPTGVELWNQNGTKAETFETPPDSRIKVIAWSPDGKWLAAGGEDRKTRLWSREGELQRVFQEHKNNINWLAWSHDSQWLVSASQDNTVRMRKVDGTEGPVLKDHPYGVFAVAWSPDDRRLVSASRNAIWLWAADGTRGPALKGHLLDVLSIDFNSATGTLASMGYNTIRLWNGTDGEPQKTIFLLRDGRSATFSAAGQLLDDDAATFEEDFVYLVEQPDGRMELRTRLEALGRSLAEEPDAAGARESASRSPVSVSVE